MSFDGKEFGKEIVAAVREYVERELATRDAKIEALESQLSGGMLKYLGVWQRQVAYEPGNMVTYNGSMWHANVASSGIEPGDGKGWTLAVKRGSSP